MGLEVAWLAGVQWVPNLSMPKHPSLWPCSAGKSVSCFKAEPAGFVAIPALHLPSSQRTSVASWLAPAACVLVQTSKAYSHSPSSRGTQLHPNFSLLSGLAPTHMPV